MQRLRRLEDQGRELMQIVSPVGPCMEAAALMLLHLDAGAFKDGNRSMTVLERDVILARIYPEETKRLARSAVLRHVGVLLFLDRVGKPPRAEHAHVSEIG